MQLKLKNGSVFMEPGTILLLKNYADSGFKKIKLPYAVEDLLTIKNFQERQFIIHMDGARLLWAEPAAFLFCENLNLEHFFEITAYLGYAEMNEIILWVIKILADISARGL
jgi:hypothetical protein